MLKLCKRVALLAAPWLILACSDDPPRDHVIGTWTPEDAGHDDSGDRDGGAGSGALACPPATTAEPLPAREVAMNGAGGGENAGMLTSELWTQFPTYCGPCHVGSASTDSEAPFRLLQATFATDFPEEAFERIEELDDDQRMPPESPRLSTRSAQDPFVRFVDLLRQWYAAGRPPDVFYPVTTGAGGSAGGETSPYRLSHALGMGLTNLGHCIPDKSLVVADVDAARALDDRFADVQSFGDLPRSLRDTDLHTLDTAVLARQGVIAFAPAYTLWADYAKKIRFIRVPVGQSVRFDAASQTFDIPANTRFYKTFLKRVIDLQGNARYRKMETRLILSRPDRVLADGSFEHTAIFGTYKWNDDESEATLHDVHYRDGDPSSFQDDLRVFVADERIEDQIVRQAPENLGEALLASGAHHTYALPGSDRCIDCHMGSANFILGFTPLQIRRRPLGEGGVIEPAEIDELNQLQRLIDYGVITGMQSADEVLGLEDSQAPRHPRNDHELSAQGYMIGNCAHCHNPRGLPSRREPSLRDVLNFLPQDGGGVFQFPLDRFSPRTFRGSAQNIRIPYITPSLYDHPGAVASNDPTTGAIKRSNKWIKRVIPAEPTPDENEVLTSYQRAHDLLQNTRQRQPLPGEDLEDVPLMFPGLAAMDLEAGRPLLAPWRGFIYRNVDAPFSYEDGGTIFPRMPMHTPGYDCRVRRLMGSWMVSIPARREPLYSVPRGLESYEELSGMEDQPYVEVHPDDDDYAEHVALAEQRLALYQASERYHDCPAPELDGVAPEVSSGRSLLPQPQLTELTDDTGLVIEEYDLLSPARPHYPRTDLRDDPTWVIRRADWVSVLYEDRVDPVKAEKGGLIALASEQAIAVVNELQIDNSVEHFLLDERPVGLWQQKPECESSLSSMPRVSDFTGDAEPSWFALTNAAANAPVYMASPGAQVFDMICSRCHGPTANGQSALASTIADLTGGLTRVANLRDGLFGPPSDPGAQWLMEFAQAADGDNDAREWAARYVTWMGLGGTNAAIPATVLTKLRSGEVMGETPRGSGLRPGQGDEANMLTVAKLACEVFLPKTSLRFDPIAGRFVREHEDPAELRTLQNAGLITRNGVADLWDALCHFNNPSAVMRLNVIKGGNAGLFAQGLVQGESVDPHQRFYANLYDRAQYPSDALVGDQHGRVTRGIAADNTTPWCLYPTSDPDELAIIAELAQQMGVDDLPRCPTQLTDRVSVAEGSRWATRGAANAGVAVFLYLDALAKGTVQPKPAYNRCEEL